MGEEWNGWGKSGRDGGGVEGMGEEMKGWGRVEGMGEEWKGWGKSGREHYLGVGGVREEGRGSVLVWVYFFVPYPSVYLAEPWVQATGI